MRRAAYFPAGSCLLWVVGVQSPAAEFGNLSRADHGHRMAPKFVIEAAQCRAEVLAALSGGTSRR